MLNVQSFCLLTFLSFLCVLCGVFFCSPVLKKLEKEGGRENKNDCSTDKKNGTGNEKANINKLIRIFNGLVW
jgi:hypothetical protein